MSKKYKKGSAPKRQPVSRYEWEDLAQDTGLSHEYKQLATALHEAQDLAVQKSVRLGGSPAEYIDLTRATTILQRSPQLIPYLDSIRKQGSSVPDGYTSYQSYLQKQSPTGNVHPQTSQSSGLWSGNKSEPDGVPNARIMRDLADSNEWVRAAINTRRQQIGRANIAVMPFNERKTYPKALSKRIQLLLDQPNEYRQNYYELFASMCDDILVLDRGVLLKDMTSARQPAHLYNEDGANIKIFPDWNGKDSNPRYVYVDPQSNRKVPLRNDECIMMMANPATYRFSLSPVQVLYNTIRADLAATKSASNMVSMKPPPHMIQLQGATQQQLEAIRARYESEIAGQKEIFWISGQNPANVTPLIFSARDNQWLEWQVYLARKIAVVFQISPQQLGITFDINKATASSQQEIFEDTGLIPLLLLIESYLNEEIVSDFAPKLPDGRVDFDSINLRILFPEISESDRQMHAERAIKVATTGLAGLPSMTLNQVLALFGEEPVEGGNTFYAPTREGPLPWLSYDNKLGEFTPWASTNGAMGGQDPLGGPTDNDTPRDGSGGSGDYAGPIQSQGNDSPEDKGQTAGANASRSSGGNNSSSNTSSGGKGPSGGKGGKKSLDNRQYGKRWIPERK